MKALLHKSYPSIPHLPGSRVGSGDHHCDHTKEVIATQQVRDGKDLVIALEKLDGSNVAIAKLNDEIVPLQRYGYHANSSPHITHHVFAKWVQKHEDRFRKLLHNGERLCGEWMYAAVGTRYKLLHEPFVAFDLMCGQERLSYHNFMKRVLPYEFTIPNLLHIGGAYSIMDAKKAMRVSGHGAIDDVEGVVWRVERDRKFDFICKYVRHSKEDGKYLESISGGEMVINENAINYI